MFTKIQENEGFMKVITDGTSHGAAVKKGEKKIIFFTFEYVQNKLNKSLSQNDIKSFSNSKFPLEFKFHVDVENLIDTNKTKFQFENQILKKHINIALSELSKDDNFLKSNSNRGSMQYYSLSIQTIKKEDLAYKAIEKILSSKGFSEETITKLVKKGKISYYGDLLEY